MNRSSCDRCSGCGTCSVENECILGNNKDDAKRYGFGVLDCSWPGKFENEKCLLPCDHHAHDFNVLKENRKGLPRKYYFT